ncbi:MAG: ferrochelatase, partial [Acidimicrobiales bacterium]
MGKTGVILAQLGGPATLDEVEPFIRSIFDDPRLVPLPGGARTRSLVSALVARGRASRVRSHYAEIGGGSPIVSTTQRQADALERELISRGHDVVVAVAHRYSKPDTKAALDKVLAANVDGIVLLPLYPQYSATTTGSSEAELRAQLHDRNSEVPVSVVRSWTDDAGYLELQAQLVDDMIASIPADLDEGLLVFSAHGIPQRLIDRGDPYFEEVESTVAGVTQRLKHRLAHRIAFQSRAGPMKWVAPDV